jgi:dUTP pyrophosphatase
MTVTREEILSILTPGDMVGLLRNYRPKIKWVPVHPDAVEPKYAHINDSGADLISVMEGDVFPGETVLFDTGLVIALEEGWELQVRSKGGLAAKSIWIANSPGTVDEGYRGRIFAEVHNGKTSETIHISKGQKVAQAVVAMFWQADYEMETDYQLLTEGISEGDNLEEVVMNRAIDILPKSRSSRGVGALGSTGV